MLVVAVVPASIAADEVNVSGGLTGEGAPLAIHGYDPVAYFSEGVAMAGSAKHTVVKNGAAYRFVSEVNKRQFDKNPERYLPKYGGFCAYGASVGKKFDGDPRVWKIVQDRLYFNLNPDIKATWTKDVSGNIEKADRNWKKIKSSAVGKL